MGYRILSLFGILLMQLVWAISAEAQDGSFKVPVLSPVPAVVYDVKTPGILLNGTWKFSQSGDESALSPIDVPGEWEMQGFKVSKGTAAVYLKEFTIPDDWNGKRSIIRFDGVSSNAKVYVNDKLIGEHEGSFVPFQLDITSSLKSGVNTLKVAVESETISDILACTSQYAAHPVGGILRKVTLFVLPQLAIADFAYTTTFDKAYKNAYLNVKGRVDGALAGKVKVEFTLKDGSGKVKSLKGNAIVVNADGSFNHSFPISSPMKWDSEHPNLYELTYSLTSSGEMIQSNRTKVGFRQIEVRGNRLFVNNMPIKLRGVNRHEVHPLRGRSLTPELCRQDALLYREANCNYIRTSHYPPSEEFLDACDELGLFVESESSLCWIEHGASPIWKEWNYKDTKYLPFLLRANYEKVMAERLHPSIIIWSLGNESRWSPLWEKVNADVKALDPSRPTAFHDQCWGGFNNAGSKADIANYHYPGFNSPRECEKTKERPTLFGEYVHTQTYSRREVETDPAVKSDLYAVNLKTMVDSVYKYDACLGGAIWSGIDDVFHLTKDKICGYGPWGIIDGWRRKKPEFIGVKNSYSPIRILNIESVKPSNGKLQLRLENRYDFTNLKEVKLVIGQNGSEEFIKSDIKPHTEGSIEIAMPASFVGEKLLITFIDPRGFVALQEQVIIGTYSHKVPSSSGKLSLANESYSYLIRQGEIAVRISKTSGQIVSVQKGDKDILLRGSQMMIIPINGDDGGAPHVAGNNFTQDIKPLNYEVCTGWQMKSINVVDNTSDLVTLKVEGFYADFKGSQVLSFHNNGQIDVSYSYTLLKDFIKDSLIRQFGMYFELPESFDRLSWDRKGLWSVYPEDDIARLKGTAKANPRNLKYVETPREVPTGSFAEDANFLGTTDFRSTKSNIYNASLTDEAGDGIAVYSDAKQHSRAWVNGRNISLLVAGVNGDGSCYFSSGRKLKFPKGSVMTGSFKVVFK